MAPVPGGDEGQFVALQGTAESIRGEVMSRGWHELPVIGPASLWINRHVPW
jgi:hypothetical protein